MSEGPDTPGLTWPGCWRGERGLRAEAQRQHWANPRKKREKHLGLLISSWHSLQTPALPRGHPAPIAQDGLSCPMISLCSRKSFSSWKTQASYFLIYYNLTSLDKAASSFHLGGFSESCDLSRSACSTSLGLTPILCGVLAPSNAKNAPLPHGR